MITIRPARPDDAAVWRELRHALWPDGSPAEHAQEIERYFAGTFPRGPWMVLLAEDAEGAGQPGGVLGFAEVSIRPYAEGCTTSRVGYLEGWFVVPRARRTGVGRALVAGAEDWARSRGCTELASDADPDNATSVAAHRALGFADAGLVRCFRKDLEPGSAPRAAAGATSPGGTRVAVREARAADADGVRALVRKFHGRTVSAAYLAELLADPANLLLVAEHAGEPVGFAWAHWLGRLAQERPHLFLYEIEVDAGQRRQGIGRALLDAVRAAARARRAEVFVFTNHANTGAVAFYRALGGVAENGDDLLFVFPAE